MKTKHLMQRIKIMPQAICPLHRNTFQKNTESVCSVQLLTLNTFYFAYVKCWTSVILGQPILRDKRRIVKVYKLKNFYFFINPIPTLIQTALKALKKTVQMYEIIYNFCTLLITENSMKLAVIHRECIVNDTRNSLHLIHTQHRRQFSSHNPNALLLEGFVTRFAYFGSKIVVGNHSNNAQQTLCRFNCPMLLHSKAWRVGAGFPRPTGIPVDGRGNPAPTMFTGDAD